ncbi:hypothetical protein HPB47_026625 [Ixodes persulcatus]|uniref:Uncharacterized protein n=1 Tax=Ixodes persulcatus TaxID=34615 RepID=A0AC60PYC9_IXOPE|nr:hypothetical protein HPB47_026625 [Ixodes persulcatus]
MLDALRCRYREIFYARPLGNRGLALVTFQGKRPPRTVLYHDFITKVTLYRPTTVVCRRCQGLGHKEKVCTKKPKCPDCGCITQEGHVCERTYCVNCHALKHLATDPKCPARIRADQMLQQKSKRGKSSNKRRCTETAASTTEKPPKRQLRIFHYSTRTAALAGKPQPPEEAEAGVRHLPASIPAGKRREAHRATDMEETGLVAEMRWHAGPIPETMLRPLGGRRGTTQMTSTRSGHGRKSCAPLTPRSKPTTTALLEKPA